MSAFTISDDELMKATVDAFVSRAKELSFSINEDKTADSEIYGNL